MKHSIKYSKWILGACLLAATPAFTACDDDDTIIENVPENFIVASTTVNVVWDETESVVAFEAPENWSAETTSKWISLTPEKGAYGEQRLFMTFDRNYYTAPRTDVVSITCGETVSNILVTQGACTDKSKIITASANVQLKASDWDNTEIPLSQFITEIEGNMGMTIDEFYEGILEDGAINMFLINNGEFEDVTPGPDGRNSMWLGGNLDNVGWLGGEYPDNSFWIQTWDEGETSTTPVIGIGRGVGLEPGSEWDVAVAYGTPDLSRYVQINIHIAIDAKVEIVDNVVHTQNLSINLTEDGYNYTPLKFDLDATLANLGISDMSQAIPVAYNAEGVLTDEQNADMGFWFDKSGPIGGWGENASAWISYGMDNTGADEIGVCLMPGATADGDTYVHKFGFFANGNVEMLKVTVKVGEGGDTPDDPIEEGYDIVYTASVSFESEPNDEYTAFEATFDMDAVLNAIGASSPKAVGVVAVNPDGSKASGTTAINGFWYAADGSVCNWGADGCAFFIEYHGNEDDAEATNVLSLGQFPETGVSGNVYKAKFGFINKVSEKVAMLDVTYTIK